VPSPDFAEVVHEKKDLIKHQFDKIHIPSGEATRIKPEETFGFDSLKINSHYIIKCLVVLPNS